MVTPPGMVRLVLEVHKVLDLDQSCPNRRVFGPEELNPNSNPSLSDLIVLSLADGPDCGLLPWLRGCGHGSVTVSVSGRELAGQRGQHGPDNRSASR